MPDLYQTLPITTVVSCERLFHKFSRKDGWLYLLQVGPWYISKQISIWSLEWQSLKLYPVAYPPSWTKKLHKRKREWKQNLWWKWQYVLHFCVLLNRLCTIPFLPLRGFQSVITSKCAHFDNASRLSWPSFFWGTCLCEFTRGCLNKAVHSQWLKQQQFIFFTVLEARSPWSRCQQAWFLL